MPSENDMLPVPNEKRTWSSFDIGSLWAGMVICVPSYSLGALLVLQFHLTITQALLVILIGSVAASIVSVCCGEPGWRYGVATPVLLKSVFGNKGTIFPTIVRFFVSCGWLGIQTLFGATALHFMFSAFLPVWSTLGGMGEAISYILFLLFNLIICWYGNESVRRFEVCVAPLLVITGVILLVWASKTLDWETFWIREQNRAPASIPLWLQATCLMLGTWLSAAVFMSDFSRFACSRRAYQTGQVLGMIPSQALFTLLGILLGSASDLLIGQQSFDMVVLANGLEYPVFRIIALLIILLATLTTNVSCNLVIPVNDLMSLFPSKINYRKGTLIVATIGSCLALPELMRRAFPFLGLTIDFPSLFANFLALYSSILSGIVALLIIDYYWVRKQKIPVETLINNTKNHHWNWIPCCVFIVMIIEVIMINTIESLGGLQPYGSVINFISGGLLLWMMTFKRKYYSLSIEIKYH